MFDGLVSFRLGFHAQPSAVQLCPGLGQHCALRLLLAPVEDPKACRDAAPMQMGATELQLEPQGRPAPAREGHLGKSGRTSLTPTLVGYTLRRPSAAPLEYRTERDATPPRTPCQSCSPYVKPQPKPQEKGGAMSGSTLVETLEDEVPTVLVVAKFIGDLQQVRRALCPLRSHWRLESAMRHGTAPRGPAALHSSGSHVRRRTVVRLVRTLGTTAGAATNADLSRGAADGGNGCRRRPTRTSSCQSKPSQPTQRRSYTSRLVATQQPAERWARWLGGTRGRPGVQSWRFIRWWRMRRRCWNAASTWRCWRAYWSRRRSSSRAQSPRMRSAAFS